MLLLVICSLVASPPEHVGVGAFFPLFHGADEKYAHTNTTPQIDRGGVQRFLAFIAAIREINADPLLLPHTELRYAHRDSRRDEDAAIAGTLDLLGGQCGAAASFNASVVVGAASSGPSANMQRVARVYKIPQVGYSATSSALSDWPQNDFFIRLPAADAQQGASMAAAMDYFEWNHVVLLSSKTTYGTNGARDFRQAVGKINRGRAATQPKIEIVHSIEFEGNSRTAWAQLDAQLTAARDQNRKARKCNIFVIFAHSIDVHPFLAASMRGANPLFGRSSGRRLLVSDSFTAASNRMDGSYLAGGPLTEQEWDDVLQSTIGFVPFGGGSSSTKSLKRLLNNDTFAQAVGNCPACSLLVDDASTPTCGDNATTSAPKDDTGTPLWVRYNTRSNLTRCLLVNTKVMGSDEFTLDGYAAFAYDAAYAVAHALHQLHYVQGRSSASGTALRDALLLVEFEGLTGNVSFKHGRGHGMGDRLGAPYLLKLFGGNAWRDLATIETFDRTTTGLLDFTWRDAPNCQPTTNPSSSSACRQGNIDSTGNMIRDGIDRCTSPQMKGRFSGQASVVLCVISTLVLCLGAVLHHWREKRRNQEYGSSPNHQPAGAGQQQSKVQPERVVAESEEEHAGAQSYRIGQLVVFKSSVAKVTAVLFQRASTGRSPAVSYTVQLATTATDDAAVPAAATTGKSVSGILAAQLQPHESRGTDDDIAEDALQWEVGEKPSCIGSTKMMRRTSIKNIFSDLRHVIPKIRLFGQQDVPLAARRPFVQCHYRWALSPAQCSLSVLELHNETLNIWSHLIGAAWVLGTMFDLVFWRSQQRDEQVELQVHPVVSSTDVFFIGLYCIAALVCFLFSSAAHTFYCTSPKAATWWWRLDYIGIALFLGVWDAAFGWFAYLGDSKRTLLVVAALLLTAATIASAVVAQSKAARLVCFAMLNLMMVLPLVHLVDWKTDKCSSGEAANQDDGCLAVTRSLQHLIVAMPACALGLVLFVLRIPERFAPGRFDYCGSHVLMHIAVFVAAIYFTHALQELVRANIERCVWLDE